MHTVDMPFSEYRIGGQVVRLQQLAPQPGSREQEVAAGFAFGRDYVRRHPQDVPWTRLELSDPIGLFTAGKIAGLGDRAGQCRALLADAGRTVDLMATRRLMLAAGAGATPGLLVFPAPVHGGTAARTRWTRQLIS